jgi:TATA-box binding protein (TBP) (component of TFIID and TFIIIB)
MSSHKQEQFDNIKISTTTIVAKTNLLINMDMLFASLPVQDVTIPPQLKSKAHIKKYILDQNLPPGAIISVEHSDNLRGVKIKRRKRTKVSVKDSTELIPHKKRKYFRNAITIVMMTNDKLINFKVPKQGKIQLTGCTHKDHSFICIKYLWKYLQELGRDNDQLYSLKDHSYLDITLRTVMTDIVFHLGFEINREHLDEYINNNTKFNSLLETTFGYTGVNIKMPFTHDNSKITTLMHRDGEWVEGYVMYYDYVDALPEREKDKELSKQRKNTFLVFYSGTAIMSGMSPIYMKDVYNQFIKIISDARGQIEEKII